VIRVHDSSFVLSAKETSGYPPSAHLEVAFAGRSNVGKSSLINALTGRKKLVKVSRTPGRTRLLNFFSVNLKDGETPHRVLLCDLPGYGYAKVSKAERHGWQDMIEGYLTQRDGLRAVVLIVDGEVGPTPDDIQMLQWLKDRRREVLVVATKIDRLNKAKRLPALRAAEEQLGLQPGELLPFSSVERMGVAELWSLLIRGTPSKMSDV
jgi:GTP-binding protein